MPVPTVALRNLKSIAPFLCDAQRKVLAEALRGEDASHFEAKLSEFAERIRSMPVTYEQDGENDGAVAYLHYFIGGHDYWITEKDMADDGTLQAYGLASDGGPAEMGYISIAYLTGHHEHFDPECLPESGNFPCVELDLYFEPKTLGEIKASQRHAA